MFNGSLFSICSQNPNDFVNYPLHKEEYESFAWCDTISSFSPLNLITNL